MQIDISDRFRQRMKELRHERGWTQEEAAEKCGIGQKLFQLYELGIKRNPGLITLDKIARGFGIEVSELLAEGKFQNAKNTKIAKSKEKRTRLMQPIIKRVPFSPKQREKL